MVIDSIITMIAGLLGTSPPTPYTESAVGIAIGAKTGLSR